MENRIATAPRIRLTNGSLDLDIWVPDSEAGFYRGSRFDWSGIINQIHYKGHTFLCPADFYALAGGACGTAEEFNIGNMGTPLPPGYEEAKPGERFVKIGVGILEKPSDEDYLFRNPYPIIDYGTRSFQHGRDWVEFTHTLPVSSGWGYHYVKRITLTPNEPEIRIERSLENLGMKEIETSHYGHNFLFFDRQPVGPDYQLELPDFIEYDTGDFKSIRRVTETGFELTEPIPKEMPLFVTFKSTRPDLQDYRFRVFNKTTGTAMEISGTPGIERFHLFARSVMICPEPIVVFRVPPGETFSWETRYRLQTGLKP